MLWYALLGATNNCETWCNHNLRCLGLNTRSSRLSGNGSFLKREVTSLYLGPEKLVTVLTTNVSSLLRYFLLSNLCCPDTMRQIWALQIGCTLWCILPQIYWKILFFYLGLNVSFFKLYNGINISDNEILVQWIVTEVGKEPLHFLVEWRENGSLWEDPIFVNYTGQEQYSTTINNTFPATNYEVRLNVTIATAEQQTVASDTILTGDSLHFYVKAVN